MSGEIAGIFFGVLSALTWGAGDFSGGVASKKTNVYLVVLCSQIVGLLLLVITALLFAEPFPGRADLIWGSFAGISGAVGLLMLYQGLASGRMGLVAPVAAVITGAIPVLFGLLTAGLPAFTRFIGFGLALLAIWLMSKPAGAVQFSLDELRLPALAGVGFGLFLLLIGQTSDQAVFWPLAAARMTSTPILLLVVWHQRAAVKMPAFPTLWVILLAGIFDTGGNAFYVLSAQLGRVDVAAVLSSLYPASTVLLAWWLLNEKLARHQGVGVVLAIVAIVLIAA